jgi:predicted kinase
MYPLLIVIHGPPGSGKTRVANALFERLERCAWLDGDEVGRIRPLEVSRRTRSVVEANVAFVLGSYLRAGYPHVILSWVVDDRAVLERMLAAIDGVDFDLRVFTLAASEDVLLARLPVDASRRTPADLALLRLRQVQRLETHQIDTSQRSATSVADEILELLSAPLSDGGP